MLETVSREKLLPPPRQAMEPRTRRSGTEWDMLIVQRFSSFIFRRFSCEHAAAEPKNPNKKKHKRRLIFFQVNMFKSE